MEEEVNPYHRRFNKYIEMVLEKLPREIAEWVSDNMTLHESPRDDCSGFQFRSETKWHAVFTSALFNIPVKQRLSTMAHEIAHCYLGHEKNHDEDREVVERQEKEADILASQWGF